MIQTNYHSHSSFCDGKGQLEEYVRSALDRHMKALGFSGHAPLPFPNGWTMDEEDLPRYLAETRRLKELYRDKIELYTGLEIDYLDEHQNPSHPNYDALKLDYRIGSVHMLPDPETGEYYAVDNTVDELEKLISSVYGGSVEKMVTDYYRRIQRMVEIGGFDIIGHLDLVKKHNNGPSGGASNKQPSGPSTKPPIGAPFFSEDEPWYRDLIVQVLDTISRSGLIVEINTGGIARGYTSEPYPSHWILKLCCEKKIPITLNSDAHKPSWVDFGFEEALKIITEAGYSHGRALLQGKWQEISYG